MRSRWFHTPLFHTESIGIEKKADWLELFYDLIFVAAFIQLGNGLSANVSAVSFLAFSGVFLALWTSWTGFTFYTNRYVVSDFVHRLTVFLQMFFVGVMAVTAADVLRGEAFWFSISFACAQLTIAALYGRSWLQQKTGRSFALYWGFIFFFGGLLWTASAFIPAPYNYAVWFVGTVSVFIAPFSRKNRAIMERYPIDFEHLSERYALLTLIVLGESFVKILSAFAGKPSDFTLVSQAVLVLLITCSVWWIYFDDVGGSTVKKGILTPIIWLYSHFPLQVGITALGVSLKKAAFFDMATPAPYKYALLFTGALSLTMISVGLVDAVTRRRQAELSDRSRVNMRLFSGLVLLLLGLTSASMSAGTLLALVVAVCVAQVIFDIMMAPLETDFVAYEYSRAEARQAELDAGHAAEKTEDRPRRPLRLGNAIRKGTPVGFRKDIYFFFMEGTWRRLFTVLFFLYLVINAAFAALYLLKPGSVSGVRMESFSDAFFFSVQTLTTIGYGVMAPVSDYGNLVVTIEAGVGLLGVALVTGLVFAKASRPQASIVFSNKCIITTMNGQQVLTFRAGNARGNDIIAANLDFTALIEQYTPEGQHIRKVCDLKLVRSRTPFFRLTWLVMHVIDDDSPLNDFDWSEPGDALFGLNAVVIGHDGTYGQTVYAQYSWQPEDVVINHRFVDIIETLPDGRIMVDYSVFHDTVPEEKAVHHSPQTNQAGRVKRTIVKKAVAKKAAVKKKAAAKNAKAKKSSAGK